MWFGKCMANPVKDSDSLVFPRLVTTTYVCSRNVLKYSNKSNENYILSKNSIK